MSTPTPITNHVQQAISKMLTPFRNRPLFAAWCKAPVTEVQGLEDVVHSFLALLDVDAADLPRLVLLGKIVGQTQRGTLEQFRRFVKVRVLVNRSRGRAPDLIKVARLLLGSDVFYSEGACNVTIEQDGAPLGDVTGADTIEFLRLTKMGGVGIHLVAQDETDGFLFGDDTVGGQVDTAHGFSSESEASGGYLAGIW